MNSDQHTTPYRCAVYFVPALHSDWWQAGSHWLGRCAATGQLLTQPALEGLAAAEFAACTAEPRRYGWHATLKAPFRLAPDVDVPMLLTALRELAGTLPAFVMPPLRVSTLGGFLALRPKGDLTLIQAAAAACVQRLHHLAMPLDEAELARRRRVPLTPAQDALLCEWGYPWVLDHFQFHLSLTGPLNNLPDDVRLALVQAAEARFHALPALHFGQIAVFAEAEKGADFQLIDHVELLG